MWWVSHDEHGAFAARGVHGQTIWIDPKAALVIARFASYPVAANAATDPTSLPACRAVADCLMANDPTPLLGGQWRPEQPAGQVRMDGGLSQDRKRYQRWFVGSGSASGFTTATRSAARTAVAPSHASTARSAAHGGTFRSTRAAKKRPAIRHARRCPDATRSSAAATAR